MMGSFITRAIIMAVGYVYPAYECFKSVEKNRPNVDHLRFWCQYWMIMAVLTVLERLGDTFISWLPMYSEAKLAFIIYLWNPKTKGTTYVYTTFLKPFVASHELQIDRHLDELTTRAGDLAFHYWQRGSAYAQSRFMELLQYVASQSPSSRPQQGPQPPISPGYQQPPSGYQPQQPPLSTNPAYQPSAPVIPTGFQPRPPSPPRYSQHEGPRQRRYFANEEDADYEVMDVTEHPPVSEPTVDMPAQRRGRQRSRRQQ